MLAGWYGGKWGQEWDWTARAHLLHMHHLLVAALELPGQLALLADWAKQLPSAQRHRASMIRWARRLVGGKGGRGREGGKGGGGLSGAHPAPRGDISGSAVVLPGAKGCSRLTETHSSRRLSTGGGKGRGGCTMSMAARWGMAAGASGGAGGWQGVESGSGVGTHSPHSARSRSRARRHRSAGSPRFAPALWGPCHMSGPTAVGRRELNGDV